MAFISGMNRPTSRRRSFFTKNGIVQKFVEQKKNHELIEMCTHSTRVSKEDDIEHVVINVGGKRFETTQSTLRNVPSSKLATLNKDSKYYNPNIEEYFFDRNPKLFHYILDFHRYGQMHIPRHICCKSINNELRFWDLGDGCISDCCRKHYVDSLDAYTTYAMVKDEFYCLPTLQELSRSKTKVDRQSTFSNFCRKAWVFLDNHESSTGATIFAVLYYGLIILSIFSVFLTTLPELRVPLDVSGSGSNVTSDPTTTSDPLSEEGNTKTKLEKLMSTQPHSTLVLLERICLFFFTIEFIARFIVCPSVWSRIKSWYMLIDILYLVPVWVRYLVDLSDPDFWRSSEQATVVLLVLDSLMILRVFRIFRLSRHYRGLRVLMLAFKSSIGELLLLFVFITFSLTIYSSFIYCAEIYRPDGFESIFIGLWWALVTMTTVGYGDMVPKTTPGYIVGCMCALTGIFIIGMVVPMIAGNFILYYSFRHAGSDEADLRKPEFVPSDRDMKKISAETLHVEENFAETELNNIRMRYDADNSLGVPGRVRSGTSVDVFQSAGIITEEVTH